MCIASRRGIHGWVNKQQGIQTVYECMVGMVPYASQHLNNSDGSMFRKTKIGGWAARRSHNVKLRRISTEKTSEKSASRQTPCCHPSSCS